MNFWDKAVKCKHKNLSPTYSEFINCWTPYCSGCEEYCLDCRVYIVTCGCGFYNGMSGWPDKRHRAVEHRNITNRWSRKITNFSAQLYRYDPTGGTK